MPKTEPFEEGTEQYEKWFEDNKYAYQSEVGAVKVLLPASGKGLEVGVGTGRFAAPLGITLGIEPSAGMAAIAGRRGISVVEGVAEDLPFSDGEFDFALMVTTVCFLDDTLAAFKEAFRVLRPGGCIVVGFVDRESHIGEVYQAHKDESIFYREATFYSTDEVSCLLREAGFRDLQFVQTLSKNLDETTEAEPAIPGYGKGAFVVIRGERD